MRRRSDGFTLIEILVVLSLLGILMGLSVGLVQRAGTGNMLIQTSNQLMSLLASARAQAYGNDHAYVAVEADKEGATVLRSFRNRQVFHWPCEDFDRASELDVLKKMGAVDMGSGAPSGEGRHVEFAGGSVSLGNPPWLQLVDGVSIRCRIRPDARTSATSIPLFKKGTAIVVMLHRYEGRRYDVEAQLRLAPDENGKGGGVTALRTGFRDAAEVPEWRSPVLADRWQDLYVFYDRNTFAVYVGGRLRGLRSDRRNAMKPDLAEAFTIGNGYQGGFDSLLVGEIFEDDDDRFEVPPQVAWLDAKQNPIKESKTFVHFRNRSLDPVRHKTPVELTFRLNLGDKQRATRTVIVTMSGEVFAKRIEG